MEIVGTWWNYCRHWDLNWTLIRCLSGAKQNVSNPFKPLELLAEKSASKADTLNLEQSLEQSLKQNLYQAQRNYHNFQKTILRFFFGFMLWFGLINKNNLPQNLLKCWTSPHTVLYLWWAHLPCLVPWRPCKLELLSFDWTLKDHRLPWPDWFWWKLVAVSIRCRGHSTQEQLLGSEVGGSGASLTWLAGSQPPQGGSWTLGISILHLNWSCWVALLQQPCWRAWLPATLLKEVHETST